MTGPRSVFESFSIVLPPGWHEVLEDGTYSDPDEVQVATFGAGGGTLHVSPLVLEEDEDAASTPEEAAAIALEWGRYRGLASPLTVTSEPTPHGAIATATYQLAGDFVQVWVLTNGHDLIQVTYVIAWAAREAERDAREAAVGSLRFA